MSLPRARFCALSVAGSRYAKTGQSSQEVCPWNSFAEPTAEEAFLPRARVDGAALIELMGMSQEEFSWRFRARLHGEQHRPEPVRS